MMINCNLADHYTWGVGCDGWHLIRSPDASVIQERMPPRAAEIPHYHRHSRQFFFVLRGILTMQRESTSISLHPGDGMEVDPGVPHHVRNESEDDVEFLVTSWPPSHGDRVTVSRQEVRG